MVVDPTQTQLKVHVKKRKKMRLYGKRATADQIMNEVVRLLHGNEKEEPLNVQEVASKLGFVREFVEEILRRDYGWNNPMTRKVSDDFLDAIRWLTFLTKPAADAVYVEYNRIINVPLMKLPD